MRSGLNYNSTQGVREKRREGEHASVPLEKGRREGRTTGYTVRREKEAIRCSQRRRGFTSRRKGTGANISDNAVVSFSGGLKYHASVPRTDRTALPAALRRLPCPQPQRRAARARRYVPRRHESCGFQVPVKTKREQGMGGWTGRRRRILCKEEQAERELPRGEENHNRRERDYEFVEADCACCKVVGNTLDCSKPKGLRLDQAKLSMSGTGIEERLVRHTRGPRDLRDHGIGSSGWQSDSTSQKGCFTRWKTNGHDSLVFLSPTSRLFSVTRVRYDSTTKNTLARAQQLNQPQSAALILYESRLTCSTNSSTWPVFMSFSINGAKMLPLSISSPAAPNGTDLLPPVTPAFTLFTAPTPVSRAPILVPRFRSPSPTLPRCDTGGSNRSCGSGTLPWLHTRTICSWAAGPHSFPSSTQTSTRRMSDHR